VSTASTQDSVASFVAQELQILIADKQ